MRLLPGSRNRFVTVFFFRNGLAPVVIVIYLDSLLSAACFLWRRRSIRFNGFGALGLLTLLCSCLGFLYCYIRYISSVGIRFVLDFLLFLDTSLCLFRWWLLGVGNISSFFFLSTTTLLCCWFRRALATLLICGLVCSEHTIRPSKLTPMAIKGTCHSQHSPCSLTYLSVLGRLLLSLLHGWRAKPFGTGTILFYILINVSGTYLRGYGRTKYSFPIFIINVPLLESPTYSSLHVFRQLIVTIEIIEIIVGSLFHIGNQYRRYASPRRY